MTIKERIVEAALADEGQQEEKGNHGWKDPDFDLLMRTTGWQDGQAWCAYWAEKIWCQVYPSNYEKMLRKLFSANAVHTFNSFWESKFPTSNEPVEGAIVIWQKVKDGQACFVGDTQWITGHAGIVINTEGPAKEFQTLEGNSNSSGGREGIEVARQTRSLDAFNENNGLKLLGFINPIEL